MPGANAYLAEGRLLQSWAQERNIDGADLRRVRAALDAGGFILPELDVQPFYDPAALAQPSLPRNSTGSTADLRPILRATYCCRAATGRRSSSGGAVARPLTRNWLASGSK
jgi:hypothetical protein